MSRYSGNTEPNISSSMINVLVVDDQKLTHKLIETYLESESDLNIVGFAGDGQAALDKVQSLKPDVVLMDVEMPIMDGLTATEIITRDYIATKVLILTVHDNEQHLSKALRIGAKGYLLKTTTAQELSNAIRYVNQGYFQLGLELTEKYLHKIIKPQSDSTGNIEFRKKLDFLYRSLNKIETKFKKLQKSQKNDLDIIIEGAVSQKINQIKDHDSHLQFKLDRSKYSLDKLQRKVNYLFTIQIFCIVFSLAALTYSIVGNKP